ncbi:hypothetical protein N7931_07375 [Catenovulum sp. 2E275]|uniref:hypothetical protein n=1 Tax=Catenovulum sp. 2E275 TaxID=2980497 RepID=UPI0021D14185|nr:hypothetical protein [Catenovulum sp. 2E275]MCU4675453.1 hypothetical protein [Catenovulum sp. 2E275]
MLINIEMSKSMKAIKCKLLIAIAIPFWLTACFVGENSAESSIDNDNKVQYVIQAPDCKEVPFNANLTPDSEDNLVEITRDFARDEMMELCVKNGSVSVTHVE